MKANKIIFAAGLFSALQIAAFGQSTNSVQSVSAATKTQMEPSYPTVQYPLVDPKVVVNPDKDKITQFGGESSQAWITRAVQQPNPTVVHDASKHEPVLCLFTWSQKGWQIGN